MEWMPERGIAPVYVSDCIFVPCGVGCVCVSWCRVYMKGTKVTLPSIQYHVSVCSAILIHIQHTTRTKIGLLQCERFCSLLRSFIHSIRMTKQTMSLFFSSLFFSYCFYCCVFRSKWLFSYYLPFFLLSIGHCLYMCTSVIIAFHSIMAIINIYNIISQLFFSHTYYFRMNSIHRLGLNDAHIHVWRYYSI